MKIEEKIVALIKMLEMDIQIANKKIVSTTDMIQVHKEEIEWHEENEPYESEIDRNKACIVECEHDIIRLKERITVFQIQLNSLKDLIK